MKTRSIFHFCILLFGLTCIATAEDRFSLEQVVGAPFPHDLVASPSGDNVAWVLIDRGVRNIWMAEGPSYRAKQVTAYGEDNGQEISSLHFTPDGSAILYIRGGLPNDAGELPNPTSDPEGTERAICIIPTQGGVPLRLTGSDSAALTSPAVSPDGKTVAYIQGRDLWTVSTDGKGEPAKLFKMRGGAAMPRWSADGSKLTFVSNRGDHSFVGVYDLDTKSLKFLSPGVDRDSYPTWSPDGKRIAFIRVPYDRFMIRFIPRREMIPWSIVVADVETGDGRVIWTSDEGPGSGFWPRSAENQILWGAGDQLVFPWEKEGWAHLYSVPASGGQVTALSPGEHEIEHFSLSPDGTEVVYSSNQDDIDRRHIWRVSVSGGPPKAVTTGNGIEWSPVMTAEDGSVVFLASDARRPAHPALVDTSGNRRELAEGSLQGHFPLSALVEPQQVVFSGTDGLRIHGQLFLPPNHDPKKRHPALVYLHGGSRRQMLLGWHYMYYYHLNYAFNQYMASRGYIVLSANYRSGTGYGLEFREALDFGGRGASEFRDVMGAGLYLRARADVDPDRIGLWGGSYGGFLTAMGLARASDLFAAGVNIHGVHDWMVDMIFDFGSLPLHMEDRIAVEEKALDSSPHTYVDGWRSPALFIHGDDDRNVSFRATVDLVQALRKRGVETEVLIFPDEVHDFLLYSNWMKALTVAADFFERKLGQNP